jgi:hypothetical protein
LFHDSPGVLGFAGFGEVVVSEADREDRAPFRLTALAAKEAGGWKLQQFHGSIPSDF